MKSIKKIVAILFSSINIEKKKIQIGKNTRISKTAKIEIKFGGEIIIGENCEILDGVIIYTYGGTIVIGNNCSINPYTIIYGHGGTSIGNDVLIAGHCMIIPNEHIYKKTDLTIREQGCISKGITIEDDVWLGHGVTITDGVTINTGSIIGAGSVVTKSTNSFTINYGTPSREIKKRNNELQ
ncbi:MAG: acyltransferase [Bacteroidota bacterium]|nr:acyltransferase [Bacteroidota bacterium]MDP3144355.1 acyltransferase [Bacteroidota bacterium]